MNAFMLITGGGPMMVLTDHASPEAPPFVRRLSAKGYDKFIAFPAPIDLVRQRYGRHVDMVVQDLTQNDDLRVLDTDGDRIFRLFRFDELGQPMVHEAMAA